MAQSSFNSPLVIIWLQFSRGQPQPVTRSSLTAGRAGTDSGTGESLSSSLSSSSSSRVSSPGGGSEGEGAPGRAAAQLGRSHESLLDSRPPAERKHSAAFLQALHKFSSLSSSSLLTVELSTKPAARQTVSSLGEKTVAGERRTRSRQTQTEVRVGGSEAGTQTQFPDPQILFPDPKLETPTRFLPSPGLVRQAEPTQYYYTEYKECSQTYSTLV